MIKARSFLLALCVLLCLTLVAAAQKSSPKPAPPAAANSRYQLVPAQNGDISVTMFLWSLI